MKKAYKRIVASIILSFSVLLLVGCGRKVTVDDLKKNDWYIPSNTEGEPSMIASFSNSLVKMKIDISSMESTAENEWEEMGEEFAKSIVDMMEITFEYTLKGKNITLLDPDTDKEAKYIVSREDDNIIFTPTDDTDEDLEVLILEPYVKKEEIKQSSEQSSSTTTLSDSTETSASSSELTLISSTSIYSEEATPTPKVTLNDFAGGWGIPNTNILFFINRDGTFSDLSSSNIPLPNYELGTTEDGRPTLTLYRDNGFIGYFVLELNGTLSTNGDSYSPLGYATIEEFRARPDGQPGESQNYSPEPVDLINVLGAINIAKRFMADGKDISATDSYSFENKDGLNYDENNQPYYLIQVRQKPQGEFDSMAIGNIIVHADSGQSFWQ